MVENFLVKLYEHNNWANDQMIQACSALSDEQLDAEPKSATKGSIRQTLMHLVRSQQGYLSLLTLPVEARPEVRLAFSELRGSARISGEALLALARDVANPSLKARVQTKDGYFVEPWVVMLQVINHATEHREQINSMLTALGVPPLELDGWAYGDFTHALAPVST
jgi:uncharacterized damage-inducible protein DinB